MASLFVRLLLLYSYCCLSWVSAQTRRVSHAPIVGGVTQTSAVIGFRVVPSGIVSIRYSTEPFFQESSIVGSVVTEEEDDYTGTIALGGLTADTQYYYRVYIEGLGDQPTFDPSTVSEYTFHTMPEPGQEATVAVFADLSNRAGRDAPAYASAAMSNNPILALQIGDFDHSNPGLVGTLGAYRDLAKKLRNDQRNHGFEFALYVLSRMAFAHIWDDHDYCSNDTDRDCPSKEFALQAYEEYYPGFPLAGVGIYHKFTVADAEFFMLDTRYHRVPNSDPDDASKTMLGFEQRQWLLDGIQNSQATWKIIVSSVSANTAARLTNIDHWRSFQTESSFIRNALLDANALDNVVMISGDLHTGGAVDDGTNNWFGIPELGVAHTNLGEGNLVNLGTWSEGVSPGSNGGGYGIIHINGDTLTLSAHLAETAEVLYSITLTASNSQPTPPPPTPVPTPSPTPAPTESCLAVGASCLGFGGGCCSGRCRLGTCRNVRTSGGRKSRKRTDGRGGSAGRGMRGLLRK